MKNWTENIYQETNQLWKEIGKPDKGYAIFFSPIKINPELMIIGENPAGNDEFNEEEVAIPQQHDYQIYDYPMAANMKKIFRFGGVEDNLFDSVKLNLNFFASKNVEIISNQDYYERIRHFSENKVNEIIEKLNPKIILAEGIGVFDKLVRIGNGKETCKPVFEKNNRIFRKGLIFNSISLIGIPHPTGTFGISDATRKKIGNLIANEIRKNEGDVC